MSVPIQGLRTAIYMVGDLDRAKAWYTEMFGTGPYFDQPSYVGFNIAGYELGLMPDDTSPEEKSENVLTYWGVGDIDAAMAAFLAAGATVHEEPVDVGEKIMCASVRDPWGNVIGLIDNPHFKLGD